MLSKPKFKIARRLGVGVYDKCQTAKFASRSTRKGSGSATHPKTLTEYGKELIEKQKVRFSYGITERQLGNYVEKASNAKGSDAAEKFYEALESRLDNVVYRMGLASSRRAGRQMVSHGHFIVNKNRITVPSFSVKVGDLIKVREGSKSKKIFSNLAEKLKDYNSPPWLNFDENKMEGKILAKPKNTETFLDLNAVLEFYSR